MSFSSPTPNNPLFLSSTNYLNSLPTTPVETEKLTSTTTLNQNNKENDDQAKTFFDLEETSQQTPDDHYAKDHPGAGWAGYKHPQYGGYLESLRKNV
jgi:hypothetical protein